MLSRLEEGGKIIVIMTRWHSDDLAGKVLEWCKEKAKKYRHISMKAIQDENNHETKQQCIYGIGDIHLESVVAKLKSKFKIDVKTTEQAKEMGISIK